MRLSSSLTKRLSLFGSTAAGPNPVLIRELQQAARLNRTPVLLASITVFVGLVMASIGGIVSTHTEPASVGVALFQVFFSVAYVLVAWLGPAVAASSIAGERSSRTWELLLVTGMSPGQIARGKFLAALLYVCLYVVMLSPVACLSFLFGGVTVVELWSALGILCLFGALWVAFALSISSKLASAGAALVVTLVIVIPASLVIYLSLGVGGSILAHQLWPAVPEGFPIWLPTAYARLPLALDWVLLLAVTPLCLAGILAWFFYEATVANLSGIGDDRSTGLRRWFLVSAPLLAGISLLPAAAAPTEPLPLALAAILGFEAFLVAMAFVFAGEPLGPSRRTATRWQRLAASRWQRFLGPGVLEAGSSLIVSGILCAAAQGGAALLILKGAGAAAGDRELAAVAVTALHSAALVILVTGLMTWLRSRAQGALAPRLQLGATLFVLCLGPWVLIAITGALDGSSRDLSGIAAPSPFYLAVVLELLTEPTLPLPIPELWIGGAALMTWALLGLSLFGLAIRRTRAVAAAHAARLAALEAALGPPPEEQNAGG